MRCLSRRQGRNIKSLGRLIIAMKITDKCVACGTCIDECPVGAISEGDIYKVDASACIDCGSCVESCPNSAIEPAE